MRRFVIFLCGVLALGALAASARAGEAPGAAAAPRPATSVRDLPGYVPLVDPESTSVTLGRRPNAPVATLPFSNGERSIEGVARAAVRALERDTPGTRDSLMRLTITLEEFRDIMWLEFPQSRPVTGLTWEDGWRVLYARLLNGVSGAFRDHGGRRYEVVGVEKMESVPYKNFTLHNGIVIVVRTGEGQIERWGWIRSIAERKGQFKIYSTRD
jgi:hypothetical protein